MKTMQVLVLSKYAIVRSALRHMLSSAGDIESVWESEISEQIHPVIEEKHPDVILLETGDASDPMVLRAIQEIGESRLPLVVLAGQGEPTTIRAMMKAGLTGYVLKNSPENDLLAALRSAAIGRKFLDSSVIDALASGEATSATPSEHIPRHDLSKRQAEVLKYFIRGYTSGQISRKMGVSTKTVETYRSRIYERLGVHNRAGLMQYAITAGLISIHRGVTPDEASRQGSKE
jgi:two-component system response regulator NreC